MEVCLLKKTWVIYAGVIGFLGWLLTISLEWGMKKAIISSILLFLLIYVFLVVLHSLRGKALAFWEQKKIGCFKGLWKEKNLSEELKRNFKNAQIVKIKVTRGSELFDKKQNRHIGEYLETLRDTASSEREVYCQFLLIAPCYRLQHVRERHKLSKKQFNTPNEFLGSWYDTLDAINKIESEKKNVHFHVEVRFYTGRHSKWRFYIFESVNSAIKTVLFSDYDADNGKHGTELPMYKVLENQKNIGGFMSRYFDEIWSVALTTEGFKQMVEEETCMQRFCEECDIKSVDEKGCLLCNCPSGKCSYEKACKGYVENRLGGI